MICLSNYTLAKELVMPNRLAATQELIIGTLAGTSTDYYLYVYKEEVDKLKRIELTTDGSGQLTLNLSDLPASFFRPYSVYYLWVTGTAANVSDQEDITIGGEQYKCFKVEFIRAQEYDNASNTDIDTITASQIIEVVI